LISLSLRGACLCAAPEGAQSGERGERHDRYRQAESQLFSGPSSAPLALVLSASNHGECVTSRKTPVA